MAKKNQKLLKISLFVVIAIFVLSTLASVILYRQDNSNQDIITLNISNKFYDFKLITNNQNNQFIYYYEVQPKDKSSKFITYFLPYEVINSNLDKENLLKITKNSFYLAFDPNDENLDSIEAIRFELAQNQGNKIIIHGILNESEKYSFLPLVDCFNSSLPVLILKTSNVTKTELLNENCIELNYVKFETSRIRDLLVYASRDMLN